MRYAQIVSASFGALVAATACATAPAAAHGTGQIEEVAPQVVSRTLSASERDSLVAQAFADRQGPRGWIYADAGSESGARRVRASFHLDDDAYVVVGHVDADGVLRIVFPTNPGDDGFVKGDKSYMTDQFFAGFNDQYRYRAQEVSLTRGLTPQMDSYDGGLGYVFMVASWRPMRFDQFSSGGIWNRYELSDDEYLKDPRPAIQELASVLTGDNREAYTVQYARYYSTISSVGSLGERFDSGYCSGFNSLGYASMPFGYTGMLASYNSLYNSLGLGYGQGGCFGSGAYGLINYGSGLVIAPPVLVTPRIYAVNGNRPAPRPQPQPGAKLHFPTQSKDATPTNPGHQGFSPDYRRRGLITTDDGTTSSPERASPRRASAAVSRSAYASLVSRSAEDAPRASLLSPAKARICAPLHAMDLLTSSTILARRFVSSSY